MGHTFLVLFHIKIFIFHILTTNYKSEMLLFFYYKIRYVVLITGQVIIPILILVSIVGLSFAYVGSSSTALPLPPTPSQPWLGISAVEVTPKISEGTGLEEASGLLVLQVAPDGPADKAGIKGGNNLKVIDGAEIPVDGDVITRIDGNSIQNLDDFRNYLKDKKIGDNVEFTLASANDDIRTVNTKLEAKPS
jgi:S1-C subfamily serine protease